MKGKGKTILISAGIPTLLLVALAVLIGLAFGQISKAGNRVIEAKTENYVLQNETAQAGQTVFLGDSITEYYPLEEFFAAYTAQSGTLVYNRGISAETSGHMSGRLEHNVLDLQPKNLVVLIGTNDIGANVGEDEIYRNIKSVIERTQTICPDTNLVLQAIYPVNEHMADFYNRYSVGSRTNEKIQSLNQKLEQLAKEKGIPFVNLTEKLADEKGDFNLMYTYDGLHPNAAGYKVITDTLTPYLK